VHGFDLLEALLDGRLAFMGLEELQHVGAQLPTIINQRA
jgi:hypothetical protein